MLVIRACEQEKLLKNSKIDDGGIDTQVATDNKLTENMLTELIWRALRWTSLEYVI